MKAIALFFFSLVAVSAAASNYPTDYTHQKVRVVQNDAVLFAHVGSGAIEREVFGYKSWGYLGGDDIDHITAVVTTGCTQWDGSTVNQTKTVRLGREWNGTGFLSESLSMYSFLPSGCSYTESTRLEIAFTDDYGNWDSQHDGHQNYWYGYDQIWRGPVAFFDTHESGSDVNYAAWAFIVEQMRQ